MLEHGLYFLILMGNDAETSVMYGIDIECFYEKYSII